MTRFKEHQDETSKPSVTKATWQVVLLGVPQGLEQVLVDAEVGVAPEPVSFQLNLPWGSPSGPKT